MKFNFVNLPEELLCGLTKAASLLGWELSEDGIKVESCPVPYKGLKVEKKGEGYRIEYGERAHFFRALGYINQNGRIR